VSSIEDEMAKANCAGVGTYIGSVLCSRLPVLFRSWVRSRLPVLIETHHYPPGTGFTEKHSLCSSIFI